MNQTSGKSNNLSVYRRLFEFGERLLSETDVSQLLTVAMDMAIEISGAERGLIILFEDNQQILFQTARNLERNDIENPEFEISRTIIEKVKSSGEPICLQNALNDESPVYSKSIEELKILSVICLPLRHKKRMFGVVYLDNRKISDVFRHETFQFVQEFSNFISSAAYTTLERGQLKTQVSELEKELRGKYRFESIVGQHQTMLEIFQMISQVADTNATVLIQGESGTGKELIARALHFNSCRRDKVFIPVNCAALPEQLLESELFGHVRGAFTGAVKDRPGWFEKADGSTIFLDEINDMSPALQARLLRVLQTGDYSRVGSSDIRNCDVRVVSATSKRLKTLVAEGRFREELYYRLNVIEICLPPLRERKSDIPLLVRHFLNVFQDEHQKSKLSLSPQAEALLLGHDFPGNIRELENIVQRAVILAQDSVIEVSHLPSVFLRKPTEAAKSGELMPLTEIKKQAVERIEKESIQNYLLASSGHITQAAGLAGLDVSNFHKLIKKYSINPKAYKR